MYDAADAVVAGSVISSRRWMSGQTTVHLVAKYHVVRVFKGNLAEHEVVIVTDTCLDEPIPEHAIGYPAVQDYCLDGYHLTLTGVRTEDGRPLKQSGESQGWLLFLTADHRPGAPQQTWLEVERTSYVGDCHKGRDDLPPAERPGFDQALASRHQ